MEMKDDRRRERKGFCGCAGGLALALALALAKPTRVAAIECYSTAAVPNGFGKCMGPAVGSGMGCGWMAGGAANCGVVPGL